MQTSLLREAGPPQCPCVTGTPCKDIKRLLITCGRGGPLGPVLHSERWQAAPPHAPIHFPATVHSPSLLCPLRPHPRVPVFPGTGSLSGLSWWSLLPLGLQWTQREPRDTGFRSQLCRVPAVDPRQVTSASSSVKWGEHKTERWPWRCQCGVAQPVSGGAGIQPQSRVVPVPGHSSCPFSGRQTGPCVLPCVPPPPTPPPSTSPQEQPCPGHTRTEAPSLSSLAGPPPGSLCLARGQCVTFLNPVN